MSYYQPAYFSLVELVDKITYVKFKETAWSFIDPYLLISLDNLRKYLGKPIYVNNWDSGGDFSFRGFRPKYTNVGAEYSQHRFGRGVDFDVKDMTAEEVRQVIIKNKDLDIFKHVTTLETNVAWCHLDIRPIPDSQRILLVKP
jgi:hypothetical protein